MSGGSLAVYWGLGIVLVLLSVWRFGAGRTAGTFRLTGLVLGLVILGIMAGSAVGVLSLDGVGACLKDNSHRTKMIYCLLYTRRASP
jgi:hypothetical protein